MRNRVITVLLSGALLAGTAWAQVPTGPKGGRGPGRMFQGLNLTEDQKAKVQALFQGERTQVQAIRSNTGLSEEQKKQQVHELRKSNHEQLLALLTPEQQAQMKQTRRHAGHKAAFNAGRRFQALNLTAEQKTQLQPLFQSTRQQMQALRADTSLTPEQKREKMKEIRQNQMAQMKSILTPEQQQQLQQRRGHRMHRGGEKTAPPTGF
jgi:Spy/CpxP family protein refolding chaperone